MKKGLYITALMAGIFLTHIVYAENDCIDVSGQYGAIQACKDDNTGKYVSHESFPDEGEYTRYYSSDGKIMERLDVFEYGQEHTWYDEQERPTREEIAGETNSTLEWVYTDDGSISHYTDEFGETNTIYTKNTSGDKKINIYENSLGITETKLTENGKVKVDFLSYDGYFTVSYAEYDGTGNCINCGQNEDGGKEVPRIFEGDIMYGNQFSYVTDENNTKIYYEGNLLYEFQVDDNGRITSFKNGSNEEYTTSFDWNSYVENLNKPQDTSTREKQSDGSYKVIDSDGKVHYEGKRIYTIDEALEVSGPKNRFRIRYK